MHLSFVGRQRKCRFNRFTRDQMPFSDSASNFLSPVPINAGTGSTIESAMTPVGSTWAGAGLNIDLDNLMGSKTKQSGPALTMNQLASNSPQHQVRPLGKKFKVYVIINHYNFIYFAMCKFILHRKTFAIFLCWQKFVFLKN